MMPSPASWDAPHQHMPSTSDDDFNQFLDMTGMGNLPDPMQYDFPGFQDGAPDAQQPLMHSQQQQQQQQQHRPEQQDAVMTDDGNPMIPRSAPMPGPTPPMSAHAAMQNQHAMARPRNNEAISNIDAQIHYLQQQKFSHQQRQLQDQRVAYFQPGNQTRSVPPTPQSIEMPPGSGQFYSQAEVAQHGGFDGNYHHQLSEQQDMAFTPLVSPAVTPLDPHFNIETAFAIPGTYFSPLTSPALHAQNDASAYDHSTHSNNSPVEMDMEALPAAAAAPATIDLAKKARKNNAAKARGPRSSIKSSPISKPLRRKTAPSPAIVSQVLSEVQEQSIAAAEPLPMVVPSASTDGSEENASVSPENLTDMPPPPVPNRRSTSRSPYFQPQNSTTPKTVASILSAEEMRPHPATPASLMKLAASKSDSSPSTQDEMDDIESLELPDSVSKRPMAPLRTNIAPSTARSEPGSARTPSALRPLASPVSRPTSSASATQSPQLQPGQSTPTARKTPNLAARPGRHRASGSVHVSPALLPRISPNIKPLLPGTPGMSSASDPTSQLLMSKSNYQNIIEGNLLPGVSYPAELSNNLTSKRTSHKIAEQGRRNRINHALQTMASLLPEHAQATLGEENEKKDGKAANAQNSKASVVEKAIDHMQDLARENMDLKQELDELKAKLQKMGP